MPSKDQPYAGLFPFSRSKTFFTSSKNKTQQVYNITPPIQAAIPPRTANSDDKAKSIESTSTGSRNSTSPPPLIIPARTSSKSSKSSSRGHRYSRSISNSVDLASLRRSVSLRSVSSPQRHYRRPSTANLALSISHDNLASSQHSSKAHLHIPTFGKRHKSSENFREGSSDSTAIVDPLRRDPSMMKTVQYRNAPAGRPPGTSHSQSSFNYSQTSNGLGPAVPTVPMSAPGAQNPHMIYQHILDTASKRISTLDYLRKAHEGRVYWFNTLLFTKPDLLKFPYFQPSKLARRATNYLLLGFSLPTILDLNSQTPTEYLRALNALLVEFEQYQNLHPPDGSTAGSLSRARIPHMFKRTAGKNRRASSAADLMMGGGVGSSENGFINSSSASTNSSFSNINSSGLPDTLYPTESYTHLLTPSLPFDPDFFETFATLCDVLIDCYTKVTQLINSPDACVGGVGELFAKADARVRKIIVQGVVREFEERCREGVKSEVAGVGKVVLGGLM